MPDNRDPVLKTLQVYLSENESKQFTEGTCPHCLSKHSIENWYCNQDIKPVGTTGLEGYSNCFKCGQKFTEYYIATGIAHYITFNEKGQKVYTCQEKTLRTANTKQIEKNSNKEESNT